jgi:uncharacterized protein
MSTLPLAVEDVAAVQVGTDEELGGPPPVEVVAPVKRQERVSSVDTLRGFALMGILIMNVCDFGLGMANYLYPLSTMKPVFDGPHATANTVLWFLRWMIAEGKMRALFSMLFGAGVILLTQRAEQRGAGLKVADIFLRRNMWLVLFGMLHAYFIWDGDILFFYGTGALLFLFPFRNVRPKRLIIAASIVLFLNLLVVDFGAQTMQVYGTIKKGAVARASYAKHGVVTEQERKDIDAADSMQGRFRPSAKKRIEDIGAQTKGYWSAQGASAKNVIQGELKGTYFGFGDWVGMMLLGMALFKNGFLTGKLSTKTYVWAAVIGLGISWPLIFLGCWKVWKGHFDIVQMGFWLQAPYSIGRVSGAIGNAAVILLVLRAGLLKWLMKAVASVGQMALSNYLLTSLSMRFLFAWGPLHWFGYIEYYKLYWVVLCMWTVNMVWSTIWLRYFEFGPMEWVWRSLTYWKRQPMKRKPTVMTTMSGEPVLVV